MELTRDQRAFYQAIFENNIATLLKGSTGHNMPNLRNVVGVGVASDLARLFPNMECVTLVACCWTNFRSNFEYRLEGSQLPNFQSLLLQAMELRKICNHPFLCDGLEANLISKHGASKVSPLLICCKSQVQEVRPLAGSPFYEIV